MIGDDYFTTGNSNGRLPATLEVMRLANRARRTAHLVRRSPTDGIHAPNALAFPARR
jgi:hypothetical protein